MHDMYYLSISELPVINSRTQQKFDDILLEYIEKFSKITKNKKTIAHLIATSIDYPFEYVKEMIQSYKRSGLLTENLEIRKKEEDFVREKVFVKGYNTLYFIYDRKLKKLKQLNKIQITGLMEQEVELDNEDYKNIFSQLFYCDDFFNNETKERDKYLMSSTLKKIGKDEYKDFFKDRIKFYPLIKLTKTQVEKYEESIESNYYRILGRYKDNYEFLNEIKKGKGYYQYNLGSNNKKDSFSCDEVVNQLLSIAKESIFIMTTKIDNDKSNKTKSFEKFDEIRNDSKGKIYIRTIEGLQKDDKVSINVDTDREYYSQVFSRTSHSKIIVIDNFFVALGSGNWFSNPRNEFEDSLVIFPFINAIKEYCPIYYSNGDYYKIFEKLVNEKKDLKELFDLYLIMKKDLIYDMNNSKNIYDELLIKKIEISMEKNIKTEFDTIANFLKKEIVNKDEFYYYLSSSNIIDSEYKNKLRRVYMNGGDN